MRNGLAALQLEDRLGLIIARWAELSVASFAAPCRRHEFIEATPPRHILPG